jgi:alcohol dehydrogenase (cytochrome c)
MVLLSAKAQEVTPERLLNAAAEPQNWLMNLGSYGGTRYSGLAGINRDNVGELVELYSRPLGGLFQGSGNFQDALPISPLVEDGFIYIVDGRGQVSKLDARDRGRIVWQNDGAQQNLDGFLEPSRGLAFYRDFVISTSADGRLHWIDKETGELVRSAPVGDPAEGYTIVAPPLVVGDRIIVGGGGADRGAEGRIDALDARTGDHLWRVDTAPAAGGGAGSPGEMRGLIGGGTFLQTGVYDASTGLTIWTAGQPVRPSLAAAASPVSYTNSAIAIDVATGEVKWHFQYVPDDDPNGFWEGGTHQIIPAEGDGSPAVAHFGNDGFYYVLDGRDGSFRRAAEHVVGALRTSGVDAGSGQPSPSADGAGAGAFGIGWSNSADCPNIRSAVPFASAYSPRTGLSYGAGADGCLTENIPAIRTYSAPGWLGAYYAGAAANLGMLSAIDPETGALVAQRLFDFPLHSGVLATAGGLVFTTSAEGTLHALDDETLEPVWSRKFGSLSPVPPVTFEVDGKQFIALVVGGNAFTSDLSYRPREMSISESIFVLVVLGLHS